MTMVKTGFDQAYQFKITLKDIKPSIWRRIQVRETYTFWGLHVAIQDAMGWQDYHLHAFELLDPIMKMKVTIGIREGPLDAEFLPGVQLRIADYFSMENRLAKYEYDFGDGWVHEIRLEQILPRKEGVDYPICIAGKRACPPEDCGGVWGYESLLEAIRDESHEEHERMLEWLGGEFDPEYFDPDEVSIDDADARLKLAFG